jgi:hypothetical protein
MARFTKQLRQQVIREFCLRRNAEFDAKLFEQEVRETGPEHLAYEWFEWDDGEAARQHRIWQAREFARDLRVTFSVEEVGRAGTIHVREVEAPMLVSQMEGRLSGGGYFLTDPANPDHMAELCRQAATDLARWSRRYEGALAYAGGSLTTIEKQRLLLEKVAPQESAKAA